MEKKGGKNQGRAKTKREDQRRERARKKKMQVFFQFIVAPEDKTVGSLKRRLRSHLRRLEIKNCMPLWREARFEVKQVKNTPVSEHFWKLRVVARPRGKTFVLVERSLPAATLRTRKQRRQ